MAFKTLMLQIFKPSGKKKRLMDEAIGNYSEALEFLTEKYRDQIEKLSESGEKITKTRLLKVIDKEAAKALNAYNAQPFKDSLKMEFASIAAAYIAQKKRFGTAGYPLPYVNNENYGSSVSELISQFDNGEIGKRKFRSSYTRLITKTGRPHPVYFGRYSLNRDYCLLYDEFKDRFYAKLYLANFSGSVVGGQGASGLSLKYVAPGLPPVYDSVGKRRYIVTPLAFGKKQYADLKKALENPAILRTARLLKRQGRYYLMVNIECGTVKPAAVFKTMGVARAVKNGLFYTVCDKTGATASAGRIPVLPRTENNEFALANEIADIALVNNAQVVLEADGGRNDKLPDTDHSLSEKQYAAITRALRYKLPEKGLPAPVEVSANGLFCTCPECGTRTRKNRLTAEIFACISCGYASESESVASENLAKRLIKYRLDKVPIYAEKTADGTGVRFYNKTLGFDTVLINGESDSKMFYELNMYVQDAAGVYESDTKKYALLKKLRLSLSVKDAVRIVEKNDSSFSYE